ncbi:hypothetical protein [Microbacterium sp. AK031]|uniref:hypothetical protein n=1 Tax=Microbacterium sp. AK031 TaxID=2723076 RepID=UPI002167B434|nr:hypothetical protein [Microbacterium sp. AK031]
MLLHEDEGMMGQFVVFEPGVRTRCGRCRNQHRIRRTAHSSKRSALSAPQKLHFSEEDAGGMLASCSRPCQDDHDSAHGGPN